MNDWDRLAPAYLSDFFAGWYSPLGIFLLALFLFGLPGGLWLLHRCEPRWHRWYMARPHGAQSSPLLDGLLLLMALSRSSARRSRLLTRLLLGAGIVSAVYFVCHLLISANPGRLTTTGQSLQSLSRGDVLAVIEFLQRWAAVGWVLMFVSLVLVLSFLNEGWALLPERTIPVLKFALSRSGPSKTTYTTSGKPLDNQFELGLNAHVAKRGDLLPAAVLVNFSYREEGPDPAWWMSPVPDGREIFVFGEMQDTHGNRYSASVRRPLTVDERISEHKSFTLIWPVEDGKEHQCVVHIAQGQNSP